MLVYTDVDPVLGNKSHWRIFYICRKFVILEAPYLYVMKHCRTLKQLIYTWNLMLILIKIPPWPIHITLVSIYYVLIEMSHSNNQHYFPVWCWLVVWQHHQVHLKPMKFNKSFVDPVLDNTLSILKSLEIITILNLTQLMKFYLCTLWWNKAPSTEVMKINSFRNHLNLRAHFCNFFSFKILKLFAGNLWY